MKNIPKKIYLNLNMTPQEVVETKDKDFHEATKTWEITWSEERLSEHDPEYIRKDAFIDKVCELLTRMIWEVTYEDLEGDSVQHYDKMEFIEDLKKTMEENKL